MTRCLWTGAEFTAVQRGPHAKKFASPSAKSEAHKAARLYTEQMIEDGYLTWEGLRRWYDKRQAASAPSCTTEPQAEAAPAIPEAATPVAIAYNRPATARDLDG